MNHEEELRYHEAWASFMRGEDETIYFTEAQWEKFKPHVRIRNAGDSE